MDPLTYEKLTQNPQLLSALLHQAHRERAQAVHRLIVLPLKRLFTSRAGGEDVARAAAAAGWSRNARTTG